MGSHAGHGRAEAASRSTKTDPEIDIDDRGWLASEPSILEKNERDQELGG